jgi:hypothetical protein
MKKSSCNVQTMAEYGLCKVGYCHDCKVFHLTIGYATLHISPEGFSSVCTALNAAMARVQRLQKEENAESRAKLHEADEALH